MSERYQIPDHWLDVRLWEHDGDPLGDQLTSAAHLASAVYGDLHALIARSRSVGWNKAHVLDKNSAEGIVLRKYVDRPAMLLVFRGTTPSSIRDLAMDAASWRKHHPDWAPPGVRFTAGALQYARRAWHGGAYDHVRIFRRNFPDGRVVLVGHSLAAKGVTTLAARLAWTDRALAPNRVCAIESPRSTNRTGEAELSRLWQDRGVDCISLRSIRHQDGEETGDWVTLTPPKREELWRGFRWLGACHTGRRVTCDRWPDAKKRRLLGGPKADARWLEFKSDLSERDARFWLSRKTHWHHETAESLTWEEAR